MKQMTSMYGGHAGTYQCSEVVPWLTEIAKGIEYLHGCIPKIIHRDLKLQNVLLTTDRRIKITDFGLVKVVTDTTKKMKDTYTMTGKTGSYRYMAPEASQHDKCQYDEKVDVFAFAIMMYELMSQQLLLTDPVSRDQEFNDMQHADKVAAGWRPGMVKSWPEDLCKIIKSCWDNDPEKRSPMADVVKQLQACAPWEGAPPSSCACVIT
mmetsp:Transcript_35382/g.42596  ORF Transcript_35382/g.42596 Transcript_35382/m.42596 type:complete len:208 (+) Transcript_35382:124-747(+)